MKLTRRTLLTGTAATLTGVALHRYLTFPQPISNHTFLLSPYRYKKGKEIRDYSSDIPDVSDETGVTVYDFNTKETFFVALPFAPHSLLGHPTDRTAILALAQKPGNESGVINLRSRKLIKTFSSSDGIQFIGHGAYSKSGDKAYFTEARGSEGFLSIRDGSTLKTIQVISTGGFEPHDLVWHPSGDHLVISNGGVKTEIKKMLPADPWNVDTSISIVDPRTFTVAEKITGIPKPMSSRHLLFVDSSTLVVGLRRFAQLPEQAGSLMYSQGSKLLPFNLPPAAELEKMKSWAQSLTYIANKDLLAATHPAGNVVSLWNFKTKTWIKSFELEEADGLVKSVDEKQIIATGKKAHH